MPTRSLIQRKLIFADYLSGRASVTQCLLRLKAKPLCRDCAAKGLVRKATVLDQIVPRAQGGSVEDSNIPCICADCYQARTAEQLGLRRTVAVGTDGWPIRRAG